MTKVPQNMTVSTKIGVRYNWHANIFVFVWTLLLIGHNNNTNTTMSTTKTEYSGCSTKDTASAMSTITSSLASSSALCKKKNIRGDRKGAVPKAIETFKGSNPALNRKLFLISPDQVWKYNDTFKAIIGYVAENYDHRVHTSLQHEDKLVSKKLLAKPSAPTKMNESDETKTVLDKDGEDWVLY